MDSDLFDISKLSKCLVEKTKECYSESKDNYQLISLTDDILIVWCQEEACMYTQTLQKLKVTSSNADCYKIQCLTLSKPPIWNVKKIICNQSGTGVLLIGKEGVAVVELPKRWGSPPLFEGGAESIMCRVQYVGDQFFSCYTKVQVVSADWHPGSLENRSIIVLSSDNYLRVYSLPSVDIPDQAIPVAQSLRRSGESGKLGMGDYAVDFGVGTPINQDQMENFKNKEEQLDDQREKYHDLEWPIFILYNNGNVFYTIISINHRKVKRKILYGPLSMVPASDDNYGLEFCNLLVLTCSPNVLVLGTSNGLLHHCIVLENVDTQEYKHLSQSIDALSESLDNLNLETSNICLHVYESVQLKLSVQENKFEERSMLLLPDPNTPARYWVLLSEGIQGVTLPFVERLISNVDDFPSYDLECHVEHFVSTRPLETVKCSPVIGLSVSMSPCSIFFLLASGAIHVMPLPSLFFPNVRFVQPNIPSSEFASNTHQKEAFEDHVRSILQRSSSQPILLSGSNPDLNAEEYLTLFTQVTHKLRQNYIQPQIKAKEAIERRRAILLNQRHVLQKEISSLKNDKKLMTENAHQLAEKYEETNDRHLALINRLEVVIGQSIKKMPILSSAEKAMLKELEDMTAMTKTFSSELDQVKSKNQWQQKQMEKQIKNELLVSQHQSSLSENQLKCLKMSLAKESEKLASVVKKVNYLKKEFGV